MTFPDSPGCFSAADEMEEIFVMAREALEAWAEGMIEDGNPVPAPRLLSELKTDPRWPNDFAEAAFIIAIDPPLNQNAPAVSL